MNTIAVINSNKANILIFCNFENFGIFDDVVLFYIHLNHFNLIHQHKNVLNLDSYLFIEINAFCVNLNFILCFNLECKRKC